MKMSAIGLPLAAKLRNLLRRPPVGPPTIFLGDSITEWWARYDLNMFQRQAVNKGIGGQNTDGLLARFEIDVVQSAASVVHIMGGTNDLWHTLSPAAPARVITNIAQMVDRASKAGIRSIIASVPPINPLIEPSGPIWAPLIAPLNVELRHLAEMHGVMFVDYAAALGPLGDMESAFSDDGVHPNRAGYAVMSEVWRAVNRVLQSGCSGALGV